MKIFLVSQEKEFRIKPLKGMMVKRFRTKLFFSDLIYKRDHCASIKNSSHLSRSYLHLYIIQFAILFEYFSSVLTYIILHVRPFLRAADSKNLFHCKPTGVQKLLEVLDNPTREYVSYNLCNRR
jgi:hypothetical protein